MTTGVLAEVSPQHRWEWKPLWAVLQRSKETGSPELPPLSVFLDAGVVPRSSREDNHNQLGEDLSKYLVVRPGDIVFNKLRTWQGGLGASLHDGIVSPAYFVCRPNSATNSRFIHYLLKSKPYLAELVRISKWMPPSQFDTPWENLRKLPLLLPGLDEQRRIADFLDTETARVDRLASARERQIAVLEECEYAEVTDALIPDSLTSAAGEWPWTWLPAPDDDAPLVRLGYIARLQSGLTVDGKRDLSGDVVTRPYLRVANVQSDRIQVDNVSEITVPAHIAKRSTLLAGDVLMTEGGDLDKLGRGTVWRGELEECLHQNHVFAVRPDASRLDADYLSLMTRTVHGRCYFESTGVKTTNLASTNSSKILGFPIPLPSLEIQRLRVQTVQRKLDGCARAKQRLRAQLDLLAERRQALITAAVTGQLDVTTSRPAHDREL
ncbi:hypothetical protein RM574_15995 [Streptomyces sp. DSM 41982]|uniref:Restriction endonuclease subunit S n=1 Tax=Streptomyces evansiae TaxID=3075535 RepID=A0ABD5E886_9ACTN|nr:MULTISPECIES: hypothetical protein [unclassified Streptomyces]MDT0416992.1 hypothetical protein [Streptomyces sp. DSM 41982]SCE32436.1 type I restriction enzyme, S subunit [Streptomyces sp. SolWspMP-sol7th]